MFYIKNLLLLLILMFTEFVIDYELYKQKHLCKPQNFLKLKYQMNISCLLTIVLSFFEDITVLQEIQNVSDVN